MFRSLAAAIALAIVAVSSSSANAQTIYAPVQYQYGTERHRYYYGGNDPAVFDRAEQRRCIDEITDVPFTSRRYTDAYVHLRLVGQLDRVYSDCIPYLNARAFGYLPVDAANDANANVPRYFRKADLLRAGDVQADGSRVVAAQAEPVVIVRDRDLRTETRPAIKPRAIIIIPKKAPKTSNKQVASAAN
jgi:hypothetical protein